MTQEQFLLSVGKKFGHFPLVWVIEDDSPYYKAKRGQVGIIALRTDGWVYEPQAMFFKWATRKNILRSSVAFFHMMRNTKTVGCCLVRTTRKDFSYMKHMEKYGVLHMRGKIPSGSKDGDVFVFSIAGKK